MRTNRPRRHAKKSIRTTHRPGGSGVIAHIFGYLARRLDRTPRKPFSKQGAPTVYSASNRNGGATVLTEPLSITRRTAPRTGTRIAGVAVSDTAEALSQEQVLERLGLSGDEFAERIFARSGVKQRHLNLSDDFLGRTLQRRTELIEQELLAHSIEAVEQLQIDPQRIGTVISASLYSLGCPTLAHRLVEHFQMDPTTDKYHITRGGCASGVPLMRLAVQAMHEHPEKHALVVA